MQYFYEGESKIQYMPSNMHMDLLCIVCCDLSTHSRELMWYIYPYPSGLFHRHGSNHTIDPSHKSHNASNKYPTMHHFVTEMCTHVHIVVTKWCIVGHGIGALWDMGLVHCGICATGLLPQCQWSAPKRKRVMQFRLIVFRTNKPIWASVLKCMPCRFLLKLQ